MFDSLEKIIKSDTFDTVVFIVVLTLVSLAAAQSALLDPVSYTHLTLPTICSV